MTMSSSILQKLSHLLDGCSNPANIKKAHAQVIVNGLHQNFALVAKLLLLCASFCENLTVASAIFSKVHTPNVFLWNTMLKVHSKSNYPLSALILYRHFSEKGLRPDNFTFSPLLEACKEELSFKEGTQIHAHILKTGFESNLYTQTQLLRFLAACGSVISARRVFDEMHHRDEVAWTALISAYCLEGGDIEEAHRLFDEMPFERDGVCWNAMIVGFIRWGDLVAARKLFNKFPLKDVVTWSAMIGGYAQRGDYKEAISLFDHMRLSVCKPNHITLVSALSSCAQVGAFRQGTRVHEYIEKSGIPLDVYMGTTLIDMYSKCGNVENSMRVFDLMSMRDIYAWNTVIEALAVHGLGKTALKLFSQMQEEGFEPNGVTFVGILTACAHLGLVKEGRAYFDLMINGYGIEARIEHYGCFVDLLGRSGFLSEAEKIVNTMPMEPSAFVWGALLSAARAASNVELGEKALYHLLELEPQNGGNYVLLSNVYAAAKRWDDVEKIRKMMRNPMIKKIHGFSTVEVGGLLYEFSQGDKKALPIGIHEMLDELDLRLKNVGHVPQTREVLHDIDEEEKEHALSWHSERLAIVFGLINTGHASTLNIVNNLRMCRDCHSVTKLISSIFSRKIVVRDRVRFHHFAEGVCSCRDFW